MGAEAREDAAPEPVADKMTGAKRLNNAAIMALSRIVPDPDQPRKTFDEKELVELSDSLRTKGLMQPIKIRWDEDLGKWVIVAGERRYRAAILAGWTEIPATMEDGTHIPSKTKLEQLIENCQRVDIPPLERARAFKDIITLNSWSARKLASELSLDPSTVVRDLQLLELPQALQEQVAGGHISVRAAVGLRTLDSQGQQEVADMAVKEGLSREEVGRVVKARKAGRVGRARPGRRVIRVDESTRIIVEGDIANAGDAALAELLTRARKMVLNQSKDRGKEEAA
jgi:ParB family chromosome partitioning protein